MSTTPSTTSTTTPDPHTLTVGGLPVHVYGLSSLGSPSSSSSGSAASQPRSLAVLFLLHGRLSSASHPLIRTFAETLLARPSSLPATAGQAQEKDLLVVAFDQRNHGHRLVDAERNLGWFEGSKRRLRERAERGVAEGERDNESHAVDMVAMQTGTARDVSSLIDFLPSALFPHDERRVTDWYVAGISLGGHATWLATAQDPRISLSIPIIASPSSLSLLTHRATHLPAPHGPLAVPSPQFPQSLVELLERIDPDRQPMSVWRGKRVCVLSGKEDGLVNWVHGGSEKFVERLEKEGRLEKLEVWVQPGT
ncbi:hypothetical protein JCM6882_007372, partial [Rhodosporidiobolus microsporus]